MARRGTLSIASAQLERTDYGSIGSTSAAGPACRNCWRRGGRECATTAGQSGQGAWVGSRLTPRAKRNRDFHEQHLAIAREIGDRRDEGNALGNLGLAWDDLDEPRKAIEYYEQNLAIAREIGDRRGEGNALGNLGIAWADLGETRKAIEYYEQDLAITREIGDRRGANTRCEISRWRTTSLGDTPEAIRCACKYAGSERQMDDPVHTEGGGVA